MIRQLLTLIGVLTLVALLLPSATAADLGDFRGQTWIALNGATGNRYWTVSVDLVDPTQNPSDQDTWEGDPGDCFTLTFAWDSTGTPPDQADDFLVEIRAFGGSEIVGTSLWTGNIVGDSGTRERTNWCFDDDPNDQAVQEGHSGFFEVFLQVDDTDVTPYTITSRGFTDNLPVGSTADNAQGYWRSRAHFLSFSMSNETFNGPEPSVYAFPDSTFTEIRFAHDHYGSWGIGSPLTHENGSVIPRSELVLDFNETTIRWSFNTPGTNDGRINNDYVIGDSLNNSWNVTFTFDEGTTPEPGTVWNASTVPSPWIVSNDNRTITYPDRFQANVSITVTHLLQLNDDDYGTPPLSKHQADLRRAPSDIGFISWRFTNARGEGLASQNIAGMQGNEKLWDSGEIAGDQNNPQVERTVRVNIGGGQLGWSDPPGGAKDFATWDDQVPSGDWVHFVTVTGPSDAVGLETNESEFFTLVATGSNVHVVSWWQNPLDNGSVVRPGEPILIRVWVKETTTNRTVVQLPDAISVFLSRSDGSKIEFWNNTSQQWEPGVAWNEPFELNLNSEGIGTLLLSGETTRNMGSRNFALVSVANLAGNDFNTVDLVQVESMALEISGLDESALVYLFWISALLLLALWRGWIAPAVTLSMMWPDPFITGWPIGLVGGAFLTFLAIWLQASVHLYRQWLRERENPL